MFHRIYITHTVQISAVVDFNQSCKIFYRAKTVKLLLDSDTRVGFDLRIYIYVYKQAHENNLKSALSHVWQELKALNLTGEMKESADFMYF